MRNFDYQTIGSTKNLKQVKKVIFYCMCSVFSFFTLKIIPHKSADFLNKILSRNSKTESVWADMYMYRDLVNTKHGQIDKQ